MNSQFHVKYDTWYDERQKAADDAGLSAAASNQSSAAFSEPSRRVMVDATVGTNVMLGRGVDVNAYDDMKNTVPSNYRTTPSAGLFSNLGKGISFVGSTLVDPLVSAGQNAVADTKHGLPLGQVRNRSFLNVGLGATLDRIARGPGAISKGFFATSKPTSLLDTGVFANAMSLMDDAIGTGLQSGMDALRDTRQTKGPDDTMR